MKSYIKIEEAIPRLRNEFNWEHSLIRELYFTTLHCYQRCESGASDQVVGDAWAPRDVRIVVAAAGNACVHGIEFLCREVEAFSVQRLDGLRFECEVEKGTARLNFGSTSANGGACWVVAKEVRVAFLGKEYLGPFLRLGHEAPREDAISAAKIDECWRQCGKCSNAWIERPDIEYSRCPECGQLTKLVGSG
jgi:hypothetical protein